jgi:hypothetical protein
VFSKRIDNLLSFQITHSDNKESTAGQAHKTISLPFTFDDTEFGRCLHRVCTAENSI